MNANPTLVLTLVLLSFMIGAGALSASFGYSLGREALRGVTQPDTRAGGATADTEAMPPRREEVMLMDEKKILADVKARINGSTPEQAITVSDTDQPQASTGDQPSPSDSTAASTSASTVAIAQLPISSQDNGVTFQVVSVYQEQDALVLDVTIQNSGSQAHRFLYSFMSITDNQGRTYNGNTEGLPGELPPNGESFGGTVSIPIALLDGAESLSLALTDYPDQQIEIQMSGIPVTR